MSEYKATIGLEIHAELKTQTKLFCNSKNDPEEARPNWNICPICMAHPGTLPVLNAEAVKHVVRVGLALGGTIADYTEFDRKNYFYPDLPKGYQISQYMYPLVSGGELASISLTRIHLEEDTARSMHSYDVSLIDFNRAGVPLMELVTEPVIFSAEKALEFARELQLILRSLNASNADMEKGQMRVEANISLSKSTKMGTKVEIKNLNSFRALERAILFEIKRQTKVLKEGGSVAQETRGWDESKQKTFSQRTKEESHDYRYFPDPDVAKLKLSEMAEYDLDSLRKKLSEMPDARRQRYQSLGVTHKDSEFYVRNTLFGDYFDAVADILKDSKPLILRASNYISSDLKGLYGDSHIPFKASIFVKVMAMLDAQEISSRGAKDLLALLSEKDIDPKEIAKQRGLLQKSDRTELITIAKRILAENGNVADDYRKGKETALQFLIGQGMRKTKGSANPEMLKEVFKDLLAL